MIDAAPWIERVRRCQYGFHDILRSSRELWEANAPAEVAALAAELYPLDIVEARSLAVYLFGRLAVNEPEHLIFLRETVSADPSWRVQEILAQAFDGYCQEVGYEACLPVIYAWLRDPRPNVVRAVTEGLRIWTGRPYFSDHPAEAVALLAVHRADESEYVRKSAGNALRDISKSYPELVAAELAGWDLNDRRVRLTHKLAFKWLAARAAGDQAI